ncbi:YjgP/YjgQ family permease [Leptospira langatensis]|uniref:YjgP/YjgQ family permease n=1 Tax=Leptospira langatensis TaxID=2484983 RepID=A0A5F1ZUH7_9LEPT|nr:LptF/LptG family permease [Leptospira langatensis]TGK00266.1 YjgP/YjgQ family permease [Leptospira langatensis]TGL41099.1 YjgP/YjgQ family permease [Leptospira langatensis]
MKKVSSRSGGSSSPRKKTSATVHKADTTNFGLEAEGRVAEGKDLRSVRVHSVEDLPPGFYVHTDRERLWRFIPILDRYILSEIVPPFLVALLFFTTVYMAIALQKMVGLFVGKGVDPFRLIDYFGYLLGNILPTTMPMACLMSGLMAAGRLSGDSEITAIRSAGIGFSRIYVVFISFGLFLAGVVCYFCFYLSPINTRKMTEFNKWIVAYNPLLALTPGQFAGDKVQNAGSEKAIAMYTEGVNAKTGELSGVQIREWTVFIPQNQDPLMLSIGGANRQIQLGESYITQIISARKGTLVEKVTSNGEYEKSIRLKDAWILEWDRVKHEFSIGDLRKGEMDYNIPKSDHKKSLEIDVDPASFTLPALIQIRDNIEKGKLEEIPGLEILKEMGVSTEGEGNLKQRLLKLQLDLAVALADPKLSDAEKTQRVTVVMQLSTLLNEAKKRLSQFNVEIQRRFAIPVSCVIFSLVSLPLGLVVKRSGKGMSFTMAVVLIILYWALFTFGSNVSDSSKVPVWLGPWLGNIAIAAVSSVVMLKRTDMRFPPGVVNFFQILAKFFSPVRAFFSRILLPFSPLKTKLTEGIKKLSLWRNRTNKN